MEKIMFAKLLAEIYRIQRKIDPKGEDLDATIYGLLNGIEDVIDRELNRIGLISKEKFTAVCDVLQEYFDDDEKLNKLTGYYDIEPKLKMKGVSRSEAIAILTYLNATNQYDNVIKKFDSSNSPGECKKFEISKYDI